jgi:hypothetical protein
VKQYRLFVRLPRRDEPQHLTMADKSKIVKRIGTVKIPVTVHFSGGAHREPYSCMKVFEVLNMNFDFILGVDILPHLFPYDDIMDYLLLPYIPHFLASFSSHCHRRGNSHISLPVFW